jgi:hypothetical protein
MSGQLKWNYLGCYVKNGPKPVVGNIAKYGSKTQRTCLDEAKNSKFFALQTGRGNNCFIGKEVNGTKVASNQCTDVCKGGSDMLRSKTGQPGCGSAIAGQDKPFSVYEVTNSIMPKNTLMDSKNIIIDSSSSSETFKNGLYSFSDSNHAFDWGAKRAFDSSSKTFWMTPYQYLGRGSYNMRRSKNYIGHNYIQVSRNGPGIYNQQQKPSNRRLMESPTDPFILIGTPEAKINPTDKTDDIVHYGEWCQINYPFQMYLTDYSIYPAILTPRNPIEEITAFPKHYVVLGSNDGVNWTTVDSENLNKYTDNLIQQVDSRGITDSLLDNFIKPTASNKLGGATKQVIVSKPYSMYRLVVKENWGSVKVAISQFILKGKICTNLGGSCNFNDEEPESFVNFNAEEPESVVNMITSKNIHPSEGFEDINQSSNIDAIIEDESFTNIYNNEKSEPLNELNVFQSDYSKFD